MASDIVRLSLESETKTNKKKVLEEFVWGVYCNGRKYGYSIRRKQMTDDELHVMQSLRGVSMGAGVLPGLSEKETAGDGELTYMRARFERVVGTKDSEAFHMINPEGAADGQELTSLAHIDRPSSCDVTLLCPRSKSVLLVNGLSRTLSELIKLYDERTSRK
ncbi:MIZU-KUSSEI 1-like protein [Tanacetum coccineum]